MNAIVACSLACFAGLFGMAPPARADAILHATVQGSRFEATRSDGSVLPQAELAGTIIAVGYADGRERHLRIDAVVPDPRDADGEVMLYTLSEEDPPSGRWVNICDPDPDGQRLAFPLAGSFSATGHYSATTGRMLITCTGGAEGKCIRFGYKPWRRLPNGTSLEPFYQACVRAVRADYCGDGVGHTQNGTLIDLFDRIGIEADQPAPGMGFEAAFSANGAVCVRQTRLPSHFDRAELAHKCPKLVAAPADLCSDAAGGLIYVRSFGR